MQIFVYFFCSNYINFFFFLYILILIMILNVIFSSYKIEITLNKI